MNNLKSLCGINRPLRLIAWLSSLAAIGVTVSNAQTVTWDAGGGDSQWGTGTNWSTNSVPGNAASLGFGQPASNQAITLGSNRVAADVNFTSIYSYTFNGNQLQLTGTGGNFTVSNSGNVIFNSNINVTNGLSIDGTGAGNVNIYGIVSGSGGLTKTGAGTLTLAGLNTYSGATTVNSGTLTIDASNSLPAATALVIGSGASVTTTWNPSALTLGSLSGAGSFDFRGATLTVGDSTNTTFSGVLSNNYSTLIKTGTGILTLSGNNTYSGLTQINQGAIEAQSATALGGSTYGNTIASGAALHLSGGITLNESNFQIAGSGLSGLGAIRSTSGSNTFAGSVTMTAASSLGADAGATLNITGDLSLAYGLTTAGAGTINLSGAINGSNGITKTGSSTLIFSGTSANSFSGLLAINDGTVVFGKSAGTNNTGGNIALGDGIGSAGSAVLQLTSSNQIPDYISSFAINSDGKLDLNNNSESLNIISGSGEIALGSGSFSLGSSSGDSTFSGKITGTGSFTKLGSGYALLSGSNTYTGATTLSGGTLRMGRVDALPTATAVTASSGTFLDLNGFNTQIGSIGGAGNITLGGATLTTGDSSNTSLSGVISETGNLVKVGSGTFTLSGANTYSGTTSINTGTLALGAGNALSASSALTVSSGATLNLAGFSTSTGSLAGAGNVTLGAGTLTAGTDNSSTTFSGVISGTGGITKAGAGTFTLSGTNTYTGLSSVTGGILSVGADANLGGTAAGLSLNNATLRTTGTFSTARAVTLSGTGSVDVASGTVLTESGVVSGTGSLNKTSAGTLVLSGTNTYSGGTTFGGGVVQVSTNAGLGGANTALTFNGGTLQSIGSFTANRAISLQSGGGTIDVSGTSATSLIASGVISGTGALTKTGVGILALTGANTYSGATNVSAGTLQISSDSNLGSGTSNLSVSSGATLEKLNTGSLTFSGTISIAGELKLGGGTLALSNANLSVGTLHISGNSTIDFGSGSSTLNATTFVIDSGVTLSVINWNNMVDFFLAQNWTGATVDLKGQAPMNQVVFSGYSGNLTAWTPFNTSKQITPVPEPSSYGAFLTAGILGAFLFLRRKQKLRR